MSTSKRDLIEAIVELHADVERQLKLNKYYIAMGKLESWQRCDANPSARAARTDGTVVGESTPRQSRGAGRAELVQETVVDELRRIEPSR
jgi:hypothetical protein